jgi:nucleotide-binding universal stress UspA family protein
MIMLHNILIPLDGSKLSETALPYAVALARRTGAVLTLVRAVGGTRSPLVDAATFQQQAMAEAEEYLARLRDKLIADDLTVQTGVPFGGSASSWIVEEVELRNVDLIVMATHDRTGPDRWIHGSVAEAVVHRATGPVMLIHVPYSESRFSACPPVVVVPLDGSELAESALPFAESLVGSLGAKIVLLGVVPREGQLVAYPGGAISTYVEGDFVRLLSDTREYLLAMIDRIPRARVVIREGDPAAEIATYADECNAAMVVMATHGRTGVLRTITGSVAGSVAHRASAPVVLIRPAELRGAEQPLTASTPLQYGVGSMP